MHGNDGGGGGETGFSFLDVFCFLFLRVSSKEEKGSMSTCRGMEATVAAAGDNGGGSLLATKASDAVGGPCSNVADDAVELRPARILKKVACMEDIIVAGADPVAGGGFASMCAKEFPMSGMPILLAPPPLFAASAENNLEADGAKESRA
jgi:hypothetical protein